MKDKLFYINEAVIFVATVFLMVYHTFTFMQRYYVFAVTIVVALLISVLTYITDFRRNFRFEVDLSVLLYSLSLSFFCLLSFFFKEDSLTYIFGKYIPYFLWPILFVLIRNKFTDSEKKRALLIFLFFYLIGNIFTISVLQTESEAARLLAGAATKSQRMDYYVRGVGGYGYVYGSILLLYPVMFWIKIETNKFVKSFLMCVLCSGFVMIFYAAYTTALLLLVLSVVLWFAHNLMKKNVWILLLIVFGGVYVGRFFILDNIILLFDSLELSWFSKRFNELYYVMSGNDYDSLSRSYLYGKSLNCFYSNPFWGGLDIGGHSEVFDMLGKYGLVGACFLGCCIHFFYRFIKNYPVKYKVSFVVLLLFIVVNPLDQMVMLPMCLFVTPLLIDYLVRKENIVFPTIPLIESKNKE